MGVMAPVLVLYFGTKEQWFRTGSDKTIKSMKAWKMEGGVELERKRNDKQMQMETSKFHITLVLIVSQDFENEKSVIFTQIVGGAVM